jgi:general secretion pathway protein D
MTIFYRPLRYWNAAFCAVLLFIAGVAGAVSQAPAPQDNDAAPIQLDLENDIRVLVDLIGEALGLNYVVDPAVKGTVKIHTNATLRRGDLLPILETILKLNNATMVRTGNFYQILPADNAARQPLPVQERGTPPAPGDQMALEVIRLKYVAATEMAKLLTPFVGPGGSIVIHDTGNILIVNDRQSNLRKLLDIVDIADSTALEGERVRFFPVQYGLAKDLADDLKAVFAGYALSDKTTAIRFVPIERRNSILVVTPNAEVFPEIEKWIQRLDQPTASPGIRTAFYKAKHGRAQDLQKILIQLYGNEVQPSALVDSRTNGAAGGTPGAVPAAQPAPGAFTALPGPVPPPQTSGSSNVRIIADDINNALLIRGTPSLIADIERTLLELDVLRRQVLIDAQIYEVALDDSMSLGISAVLQNRAGLSRSTTGQFASPAGGGTPSLSAQTFAYVGRTRELLLFLNASENRSRVKTISAPSVLVSDNLEASFQVGAEIPVPTSSSISPVQSDGTNLFAQTIQFRSTGVLMKVKPQVNQGGSVTLDISQEVSQASANTTSSIVAPIIGKSSVTSTIVIDDGQTIALGGFIRENRDSDQSRIPLLGRIPGIGALFGNTTNGHTRTELIILITPHVLETRADADVATEELKAKLKNLQELFK